MSASRGQRATTSYKEREKAQQDPYAMLTAPRGPLVCPQCHAVFAKKRWVLDEAEFAKLGSASTTKQAPCPACRPIRDHYPEGIVALRWPDLDEHEAEIRGLIVNEETRALAVNPLARLMKVVTFSKREMEIQATSDQLAQRIGRELVRAFGGKAAYRWAHKDRLLRVEWAGPSPPAAPRSKGAKGSVPR
ncbi:MAG: BCAM0308 family protein [Nitrospira sp.]|nr:BCAM0308 family protein [Nitrospira sp.]